MVTLPLPSSESEHADDQPTQVVVLPNISWQTYQAMLADMGDHRATRLAYNLGVLTLKRPSKLHEIVNRLLARIVTALTEELGLDVVNVGSTTLNREDLKKGVEPDTGFYIQNAALLEGLDPEIPDNLPPDLVVEVAITSPSTARTQIYQALGVLEVWRYTQRQGLVMYQLQSGTYIRQDTSLAFSTLSTQQLNLFLAQRQTQSENQVIRAVRDWAKSHKPSDF
ncbi:MAG: Uma2 family endonuclease [Cyanobacteria bacterium J06626_23]